MRLILLAVGTILIVGACAGDQDTSTSTVPTAPPAATTTTATPVTTTPPPVTTTAPLPPASTSTTLVPTPLPPVPALLTFDGPEEVVFDWTTDACDTRDIPDLPARAFRDANGLVSLLSTHPINRRSTGPTLNDVTRDCEPIFKATRSGDPAQFTDEEWIASVYTEDGETIYALVHNEYQGWSRGDCVGTENFNCWYNSITSLISTDGGKTFTYPRPPPEHLVASLPYPYIPDSAAVGVFSPSNIVRDAEGFYYALVKVGANRTGRQTVCLMRTDSLDDPTSWRFWNGTAFDGIFVNPYTNKPESPSKNKCPALAINEIGAQMIESLTWNTFLNQWVLVGISADTIDGREVWGFYYSYSTDLINWTRRELLIEIALPWTVESPGTDVFYLYPSLLDPNSDSMSFMTTGETAYLYYTRMNSAASTFDRDLLRVPVRFSTIP